MIITFSSTPGFNPHQHFSAHCSCFLSVNGGHTWSQAASLWSPLALFHGETLLCLLCLGDTSQVVRLSLNYYDFRESSAITYLLSNDLNKE